MNRTIAMDEELSFTTAFCSDYEKLLDHCQLALAAWSDRSEYAREADISGEAVGRELLRLQARFAKCYAVLQKHVHSCERCVAASQIQQFHLEHSLQHSVPVC